jgi:hypothetical protein
MYNQYVILADAKPGRDDEYDDWYVWVHTHDVMRARPAAISAQCFRRLAIDLNEGRPARYTQNFLCLYENSNPVAMTGPPYQPNDEMLISSAADTTAAPGGGYYDTMIELILSPGSCEGDAIVVECIEASAATVQNIEWYISMRFSAFMQTPGVLAGWLGKASAHQIFPAERPGYVAVYRLAQPDIAAPAWAAAAACPPPWDTGDVSASCFRAISQRLTRLQLLEPDDVMRETAQMMRGMVVRREEAQSASRPASRAAYGTLPMRSASR